ncbi:unnamed protein product [Vitrella brassicaformis CCMP3155]|uniref:EF-hand domain-containing protein n=1 Tax=Vitrella brassicaformis (strain CCMP3155) TaxID=1169540 RepID=A0A0G4G6U7_VITBC|nr:unnamed protein product [Vitrella brassicaformis CCMP3155]|eukprot:CEM24396.1 unnamed protein product [Vitrella brassicaformis CCMP3155]
MFRTVDKDHDGMLSQDEGRAFFRFFSLPESAADILFDAMDDDRSGTIDYLDAKRRRTFLLGKEEASRVDPAAVFEPRFWCAVKEAFKAHAKKYEGLLTRDEMVQVCRQFGIKENVATMEYDRLATEHGIDYMEFILHLTPYVDPARVAPPGRGKRRQSSHVMED